MTSHGAGGITVPYLVDVNHGGTPAGRIHSPANPLQTLTVKRGQAICVPFIVTYYSNGKAYPVTSPLGTLSTHDRCALATAVIESCGTVEPRTGGERKLAATMAELGVADVGFRMLVNRELSLATGFPASYIFRGGKTEVTKQIGNAVSPDVANAITLSLAGAA